MAGPAVATTSLWRHPDFLKLWAAQAGSAFGSRITRTVMPMLAILTLHADPIQLSILAALSLAPAFAVGLVAGPLADRAARRPLMVGADLVRAVLVLSVPLAAVLGGLGMAQLYVVAALAGAATTVFEIADRSLLPGLVGADQLIDGNAKLQSTEAIAEASGPGIAGLLVQLIGAAQAMAIDGLTYLWSAFMLLRIRTPEPRPEPSDGGAPGGWLVGYGACWRDPILRPLLLVEAIVYLAFGSFATLYTLVALKGVGLSPLVTGVIVSLGGLGAFAGSFIAQPLARRLGTGKAMALSLAIGLGAALLIPLALSAGRFAVPCLIGQQLLGDAFFGGYMIQAVSLRQRQAPAAVLGRVNAAFQMTLGIMLPISALAAGPLIDAIGLAPTTWIAGACAVVAIPVLAFSRVARLP